MADQTNGSNNSSDGPNSNLEGFIESQMKQQEKVSKETDNLDTEKRDKFIERALAESRRMNMEIEKSKEKRDRLHAELGQANIDSWRNEHSAEVLTAQQTHLVNQSYAAEKS